MGLGAQRRKQTLTEALPSEVLSLVLAQLCLVRDIKSVKRTCRAFRKASRNAEQEHRRVCYEGHADWVTGVAAAPDGRVVTCSKDGTIKLWRDGACKRTIQAHTSKLNTVALLPGGARMVSVSTDDRKARLWTLDGALARRFKANAHGGVYCIAALPDGVHFVVGLCGLSGDIRLYHVDGTLVHNFKGHASTVWALAVTRDGQHIISGSEDKHVKVWSVASKSLVSTCAGHTDFVDAVAVLPNGQRILSGSTDGEVRVWLLDGTRKNTFELHADSVRALVALPDNQHALSGSWDKTAKLFNVNDGAVLRTFTHHTDAVTCLALLPDGRRFVSGSEDKTARIAEHGFAFEPDPAWLDAEAKAKAKREAKAKAKLEAKLEAKANLEPKVDTIVALAVELFDARPMLVPPENWLKPNPRTIPKKAVAHDLLKAVDLLHAWRDPIDGPAAGYPETREIIDRLLAALQNYSEERNAYKQQRAAP
jgi:hypothetical protein